jgi:hypothetical protein
MIVYGSIRHDYSGKKRKTSPRKVKPKAKFVELTSLPTPAAYRPDNYPLKRHPCR